MGRQEEYKPLIDYNQNYNKPKTDWSRIKEKYFKKDVVLLAMYVVLYISSGVVNSIFLKKVMNSFRNYGFFLNQLTNYGYIPIFGGVVLYEMLFTKFITKEMRLFPWWKFFIMGALDAVCGYFVVIGGLYTSGPMQQLLNQAIIPVTMIGAYFVLKERYSLIQIGGALLIVGGVVLSLVPSLKSDNSDNIFFWNMFYLLQIIPFAASNVYKDIAFKAVDMDVWYLQFWDVFWQSVIGTLLFPINTIIPPPSQIKWGEIPSSMRNGASCLLGHNLITPENSQCGHDSPIHQMCDDCQHAWILIIVYMAVNVAYNVFILLVIKYGSATILSIAQTVRLPLTNICFSVHAFMGSSATKFSGFSLYGLLVILAGLTSYRVGAILKKPKGGEGGEVKVIPHIGPGGSDYLVESVASMPLILPKSSTHLRKQYLAKLGVGFNTTQPLSINP